MENSKRITSLPERRQMGLPPPEKKPKWSNFLGMVLRGVLIWMPRLWKAVETVVGWLSGPPS